MLEPPALKRLMGPRALLPLALAVAVIFHFVTAGWNPIGNGVEGECAGQAREMFQRGAWTIDGKLPDAPLVCWLVKISFRLFGVSEFSARAPIALSVLVAVLFLFLLAERIGGSWRGFLAGMILLCSPGMFTVARTISAGPVFAALLTAAFYCAYRGFEMRNTRRGWLAAFWLCIALAAVATGWRAFLYPALVIALMSACYREARIRFKRSSRRRARWRCSRRSHSCGRRAARRCKARQCRHPASPCCSSGWFSRGRCYCSPPPAPR